MRHSTFGAGVQPPVTSGSEAGRTADSERDMGCPGIATGTDGPRNSPRARRSLDFRWSRALCCNRCQTLQIGLVRLSFEARSSHDDAVIEADGNHAQDEAL